MNFAEMMFYAEEEGLLPTRRGKLNAAISDINYLLGKGYSLDLEDYKEILYRNGIDYDTLSESEFKYFTRKI